MSDFANQLQLTLAMGGSAATQLKATAGGVDQIASAGVRAASSLGKVDAKLDSIKLTAGGVEKQLGAAFDRIDSIGTTFPNITRGINLVGQAIGMLTDALDAADAAGRRGALSAEQDARFAATVTSAERHLRELQQGMMGTGLTDPLEKTLMAMERSGALAKLTSQELRDIGTAALALSREAGTDSAQVLGVIQKALAGGEVDALKQFGVVVDANVDKSKRFTAVLEALQGVARKSAGELADSQATHFAQMDTARAEFQRRAEQFWADVWNNPWWQDAALEAIKREQEIGVEAEVMQAELDAFHKLARDAFETAADRADAARLQAVGLRLELAAIDDLLAGSVRSGVAAGFFDAMTEAADRAAAAMRIAAREARRAEYGDRPFGTDEEADADARRSLGVGKGGGGGGGRSRGERPFTPDYGGLFGFKGTEADFLRGTSFASLQGAGFQSSGGGEVQHEAYAADPRNFLGDDEIWRTAVERRRADLLEVADAFAEASGRMSGPSQTLTAAMGKVVAAMSNKKGYDQALGVAQGFSDGILGILGARGWQESIWAGLESAKAFLSQNYPLGAAWAALSVAFAAFAGTNSGKGGGSRSSVGAAGAGSYGGAGGYGGGTDWAAQRAKSESERPQEVHLHFAEGGTYVAAKDAPEHFADLLDIAQKRGYRLRSAN